MCIGVPMRVVESGEMFAICESPGGRHRIDVRLVGEQPSGTWLLTFMNAAREVLTEEGADQITNALQAVDLAMQGEGRIDQLFADLVDREPELPEFLRPSHLNPVSGD